MRTLTVDLFVSLDGYAAGVDTPAYFGYGGPELDAWVDRHMDEPQLVVLGRVTYELFAGFSADAGEDGSGRLTDTPKLVVSNSLEEPLAWANTSLLRDDLEEGMQSLKEQAGPPLRTMGSLSLVASLFELGLVDRLCLMVFPFILGDRGREPLSAALRPARLGLVEHEVLDSRLVVLEYGTQ